MVVGAAGGGAPGQGGGARVPLRPGQRDSRRCYSRGSRASGRRPERPAAGSASLPAAPGHRAGDHQRSVSWSGWTQIAIMYSLRLSFSF